MGPTTTCHLTGLQQCWTACSTGAHSRRGRFAMGWATCSAHRATSAIYSICIASLGRNKVETLPGASWVLTPAWSSSHYKKEKELTKKKHKLKPSRTSWVARFRTSAKSRACLRNSSNKRRRKSKKLLDAFDFRAEDKLQTKKLVDDIDERIADLNAAALFTKPKSKKNPGLARKRIRSCSTRMRHSDSSRRLASYLRIKSKRTSTN